MTPANDNDMLKRTVACSRMITYLIEEMSDLHEHECKAYLAYALCALSDRIHLVDLTTTM
jgi:hypothetical protein